MELKNYNTNLIGSNIPDWHFPMLNDKNRNILYYEALKKHAKDKVVLDLGSGSGLLSMIALDSGAKKVFAVEQESALVEISKKVFADNKIASDKLVIINSPVSKLKLGEDVDTPIDLVVTEIFDCGLIGEGCLESINYIKPFLSSKGTILPAGANIYGCLINSKQLRKKHHLQEKIMGFDLESFSELRQSGSLDNVKYYKDFKIVSDVKVIKSINFNQSFSNVIEESIDFELKEPCLVDAMVIWFDLNLSDGVYFNSFKNSGSHWDQWFLFPKHPMKVTKGNRISVKLHNVGTGRLTPLQWKIH